jgi:hypothetical protein
MQFSRLQCLKSETLYKRKGIQIPKANLIRAQKKGARLITVSGKFGAAAE